MIRRRAQRRDPMDGIIKSALQPGRYIQWNEGLSFVEGLHHVEGEIAKVEGSDPARAVVLYETFIAGCNLKAEEIDDSDADLGTFAGGLFCGWIKARQAAGADREETASLLLSWMDDDDYGFCNDLEHQAAKVLDRPGLEAFEREVRVRFDAACAAARGRAGNYACDQWGRFLRSIYSQQRSIQKYLDLAARTELTQADCEAIATMFQAKRKPNDALAWIERGLQMEKPGEFQGAAGHKLAGMRRALLAKLGRGNEALDSAWAGFQAHPDEFTYRELLRYVPKAERGSWHEKAMTAAEQGNLASLIGLWLSVKEIKRLAERLDRASNRELERLSHYVTEPAAERLAKTDPGVAAKVFRALCIRILDAGKSKYYYAALTHIEEARRCYQEAGLDETWKALVAEIRRDHHRKSGVMPGFEAIVAGKRARVDPSLLGRARGRWVRTAKV